MRIAAGEEHTLVLAGRQYSTSWNRQNHQHVQGEAGPDHFRTAPLCGVGQRLFFLHDGRTSDLMEAIEAHMSPGKDCVSACEQQKPYGTLVANGISRSRH